MSTNTIEKLDNDAVDIDTQTMNHLQATSISGVITSLDKIIAWSIEHKNRAGYFAALYRKVTIKIRDGIEKGEFEDGARMETLDVIFANRYLEAFEQYYNKQEMTKSWELAFQLAEKWEPIVLVHLMIGMNAHINLDLGIAAAQTVAPDKLPELRKDFEKINSVLSNLVDDVQSELATIWPLFRFIDKLLGRADEKLADFGMKVARDNAWKFAVDYSKSDDHNGTIKKMDCTVSLMGTLLTKPGLRLRLIYLLIRLGERQGIDKIIKILT